MKNILYLLSLSLTLIGCEKYELETYPTLDGTYMVISIRHDGVNTYNGTVMNDYIDNGIVTTTIGDLDVGNEKVSFSGRTFYMGYQVVPGDDDWVFEYPFSINRGEDGYWDDLTIDYRNPEGILYPRDFIIEEDGLEHLVLKFPNQHLSNGENVNMWIRLSRVGP